MPLEANDLGGWLPMTETLIGPRRRLFPNTPDTQFYYPASGHELVLARMLQAITDGEGFVLLAGEPGTGKTLLCHALVERLGSDIPCAFLTNSHFPNRAALLKAILFELSVPHENKDEQELRLALTDFLLKNFADKRRALIIIDEAQNLSTDLLEELRLLGNLEARGGKALQIVIAGLPTLLETLDVPELAPLKQRLATRLTVDALSAEEAADYLKHHVRAVGTRFESVFTDEALSLLAKGCKGIPRILNQAAHQAISLANQAESMPVDAEAAMEALNHLGLELPDSDPHENPEAYSETETMIIAALGQEELEQPDTDNPVEQPSRSARLNRLSVMS
jgi:general secretion pathway protein A